MALADLRFQSLRRDSVGSHHLSQELCAMPFEVSIPQAGFCRFTLFIVFSLLCLYAPFQSLRRDSVGSHRFLTQRRGGGCNVSIPQAGFCRFTLSIVGRHRRCAPVSIPQAGFCRFTPPPRCVPHRHVASFNPSGGIL